MALLSPPPAHPYPTPTDTVVVGFQDTTFDVIRAMDRDSIKALNPFDGSILTTDPVTLEPTYQTLYAVIVAMQPDTSVGVIVAVFTTREERRAYIADTAQAWFVPPTGS